MLVTAFYEAQFNVVIIPLSPDIPSAPGRVVPTRNTDTSVVVSWEASRDAKELVGYYIETSVAGSNVWEPCNNKPVKVTRYSDLTQTHTLAHKNT